MAICYRTGALVLLLLPLGLFSLAGAQSQKEPAPGSSETVTYQDMIKLLRSGKSEKEILEALEKTTIKVEFVLGTDQVAELQKMRVSDDFIEALKKRLARSSSDVTDFVIILDCSGSMMEKTRDGITKMEAARQTVTQLIQKIPNGLRMTFIVYGHDVSLKCEAVKVVRPLSELDDAGKAELTSFIAKLQPVGHTPIALALRTAGKELAKSKGLAEVFLITDGMETCDGDPAKEAADLVKNLNLKTGVNVIGFGLENPKEREAVEKIAKAGKGKYYDARSAKDLIQAVAEVEKKIAQAKPAPAPEAKPAVVEKVKITRVIRTVKVLSPAIKLPPMEKIVVTKPGDNVTLAQGKKYDEEIRIALDETAETFDICWVPKTGVFVRMATKVTLNRERPKPEDHLGIIRVGGKGLPKANKLMVTKAGGSRTFLDVLQHASTYGQDMVVAAGSYDVYLDPAENKGRFERLAEKLEVKPGKVMEIE